MTNSIQPFAAPDAAPDDTLRFFEKWFAGGDPGWLTSVVRMRPEKTGTRTLVAPLGDISEAIRSSGLDPMIWDGGAEWDMYTSVGYMTEKPKGGLRGGLSLVRCVPGVWLDLDVGKEGAFTDQSEAWRFACSLGVTPTLLVTTGTGGVHAYWKTDEMLSKDDCRRLCERWYIYAREIAGGTAIDKLCNPDRIMRLPGSIRWPKKLTEPVSVCRLQYDEGPILDRSQLVSLTDSSWADYQDTLVRTREYVTRMREDINVSDLGDNRWMTLRAVSQVEDIYNDTEDWGDILVPLGWAYLGTDNEERRVWSRPGDGGRKSATTDWPESPNTMSLFSTSPETGLLELHEAGIALTKYRVNVQLHWGGNEAAFVRTYTKQMIEKEKDSPDG